MNVVKPEDLRRFPLGFEMAAHRVPNLLDQLFFAVGLREDAFANGTGRVAAFKIRFDEEE